MSSLGKYLTEIRMSLDRNNYKLLKWVRHTTEADLSEDGTPSGAIPTWVFFLMWNGMVYLLVVVVEA